jgi:F-type H+-transporting ATPase subunit gamma
MANIKDLKKKIKSTKSTLKITTAMKLVSAAKMNKAQHAITSARPYTDELEGIIKTVSAISDYTHDYLKEKESKLAHLIVVSANKGLCGGYNSQLGKEVKRWLKETDLNVKVHFIGKKLFDLLGKDVNKGEYFTFNTPTPSYINIADIGKKLAADFETGEVGKVFVAYNVFRSAISFIPTVKQLLPISSKEEEVKAMAANFPFDYKYEPSASEILDTLVPESYLTTLYTCILDATAAEHGSRMAAMDSATKNCKKTIRSLTLKANKLRQAAITTELIEVVSGAEALNA